MNRWITKKIADIADVVAGGTPSTNNSEFWNGDIGWITPADLSGYKYRYIANGARNISSAGLNNSSAYLLPKNAVLLSSRAPIGYVAIAEKELATNQGFKNLICDDTQVDYRFMYYWLQLNADALKSFASGATFPELSAGTVKKIKVTLPDMVTQNRIADILFAYDELIEANTRRIELLEQTAQELYKEWFVRFRFPGYENTKFEDGIPEGWGYVRFGKAIDIIDGDRGVNYPKQEEFYPEGDCLFLNAGNVTTKGFDFSSCAYITKEKDAILRKGKLQHGDVVLTTRGTVGNAAFYNETLTFSEMRINSGMVILRNLGVVSPEYIYTALRHEYLQKLMSLYASGSAQPQLPIKDMKRMKIIKADAKTMECFTEMSADIYNQISLLIMKNQTLTKQRDMLLPRLMSGKLEV